MQRLSAVFASLWVESLRLKCTCHGGFTFYIDVEALSCRISELILEFERRSFARTLKRNLLFETENTYPPDGFQPISSKCCPRYDAADGEV